MSDDPDDFTPAPEDAPPAGISPAHAGDSPAAGREVQVDRAMSGKTMIPLPPEPESFETAVPVLSDKRTQISDKGAPSPAQLHVICACLLDEGATLDAATAQGLTAEDFGPPLSTIFSRLTKMRAAHTPIALDTLVAELGKSELRKIGGLPRLLELADPQRVPTTARASYFILQVKDEGNRAKLARIAAEVVEATAKGADITELLQETEARIAAIRTGSAVVLKAELAARLQRKRVTHTSKPPEPVTRLFLADKPIATPGNIVTLISRAKTGKTAVLGAATAAIIAATTQTLDRDTFKFRASNPAGHAVIVIDTEQSRYDAWVCYHRALKRAGDEADPAWLHHYSLVGDTPHELLGELDLAIETAHAQCHGIFCIILDGCADFVNSVNDEAECNGFVTLLRKRATDNDCPILAVIHSNEAEKSGDDGRGHLGKQLIRKAESNLLLKKDGDITSITSDKQRKAPITEADQVAFQWSDEAQMHVSCTAGTPRAPGGRKRLYTIQQFMQVIPVKGARALSGSQIHRIANDLTPIKLQTFKDLLNEAAEKTGEVLRFYDAATGFSYTRAV